MEIPGSRHTAARDLENHHHMLTWGIPWGSDAQPSLDGSAAPRDSVTHAASGFFTTALPREQPNVTNCTEDKVLQEGIELFQLIVYIPTFSLGIPLTMTAFWVFCCKLKMWTETRVYMINLMIADSFLLFALPFMIYFIKYDRSAGNLCSVIEDIYFTNRPMSILIITLIAIDRYIAIKFPLKAKALRSPLKSASICVFLWITLIVYAYLRRKIYRENVQFCFQKESTEPNYLLLFSIIFGYFIPLGIVIFCSVQVITCLKKKMATSPYETKLMQKAIHIISVNLCVFIVCFSPFYITLLLRFAVDFFEDCSLLLKVRASIRICACLANSNCCLDALCYYFAAKEFQEFPSMFPTCISMRFKMNQSQESQPSTDQVMI